MKIALIGYGKMGRMIEKCALERGHEIVSKIDVGSEDSFCSEEFRSADAAIEFSVPSAASSNVLRSLECGVPVVCGTTGWNDRLPEVEKECLRLGGAMLVSSNFSIGMNLLMAINVYAAGLISRFPQYCGEIDETHHIHKLDHPSGTAITLAKDLISSYGSRLKGWTELPSGADLKAREKSFADGELPIRAFREGEIPGIHNIVWTCGVDTLSMRHEAFSREGFASGAVMAAEWIAGRKGVFTMTDFLGF